MSSAKTPAEQRSQAEKDVANAQDKVEKAQQAVSDAKASQKQEQDSGSWP